MKDINPILAEVSRWAATRCDIVAVALVGSWARGAARPDSDIDLVLLTPDPLWFRRDQGWMSGIEWSRIGTSVAGWQDADYGALWSRHVRLADRTEVEFGFAAPHWASIDPLDVGTFEVIRNGCGILFDAQGLLDRLAAHAKTRANPQP